MIEITKIENPRDYKVLTTPAEEVTFPLSESVEEAMHALKRVFREVKGVGLAAPQINSSYQFFVIGISKEAASLREEGVPYPETVYFNPHYFPLDEKEVFLDFEGCFSVGSKCGWVPRYHKILFEAQNEKGEKVVFEARGFLARVLQHETDHLQGVLITDRLKPENLQGTYEEMLHLRREYLAPEKREIFDAILKRQEKK